VSGREVVRPFKRVAKTESHDQVGMKSIDTRSSCSFRPGPVIYTPPGGLLPTNKIIGDSEQLNN
jgi:hypothetical protein